MKTTEEPNKTKDSDCGMNKKHKNHLHVVDNNKTISNMNIDKPLFDALLRVHKYEEAASLKPSISCGSYEKNIKLVKDY